MFTPQEIEVGAPRAPDTAHYVTRTPERDAAGERTALLSGARRGREQTTVVNPPRECNASSRDANMPLKEYLAEIKVPVYVFTILFAIASWVDINGVWTEMPLLVNVLPEGWNLPSYLTIIIQVANIGPIAYTLANRLAPHKVTEWPVVYIIIGVGGVSCVLLVFFWDATSYIGGELRSTGLLTLTCLLALVDCTSSVVFLPYMALYKAHYMTAYYIGEGLSGMIPAMVGLAQGVSQDPVCVNTSVVDPVTNATDFVLFPHYPPPRFSIETFWWVLFGMIVVSGVSFSLLHWLHYCKTERNSSSVSYSLPGPMESKADLTFAQPVGEERFDTLEPPEVSGSPAGMPPYSSFSSEFASQKQLTVSVPEGGNTRGETVNRGEFAYYLVMVGVACALTNGVLPAIQSYSCLPYGNLAYTLTIRLGSIANPLACFVALFTPPVGRVGVGVFTLLGSILSAYQIFLASASPNPPLQDETMGIVLVVLTSILLTAFLSYVKVAVAIILRKVGGHDALLWCGVVTQAGSFVGAVITFICVNVANLLTSAPPCPV